MKFIVDMNIGLEWVDFLKSKNYVAEHWSRVGNANAIDTVIMQWARDNESVILTQDLDFGHLHAIYNSRLPSVIQIRSDDLRPMAIGALVVAAIESEIRGLAQGAILTIEPPSARFRPLPIIPKID